MDLDLNILRIDVDRSGRVTNTKNLSLNQCSTNNRIHLYYDGDYDYIEMSFRKPDGWLSDKVTLTFDVDENKRKYAYYDISEEFTSFTMGGRNAILQANIYLHYKINGQAYIATVSSLRINVSYVDDAAVNTLYTEAYMVNINSQIGALQNDFNQFKTGDILVGKAEQDQYGQTIDVYYETKSDAEIKYNRLDEKKLDRSEIQDQTTQLETLKTNAEVVNKNLDSLNTTTASHAELLNKNASEIQNLKDTTVTEVDFDAFKASRVEAELALQKQIDDLASSTNVKDIVGTRADLNKYNTTNLEPGDKIQILSDSEFDDLSTILRWNGVKWEYVGKYSSTSYTRSEIDVQHTDIKAMIPNKLDRTGNRIVLMNGSNILGVSNIELKTIDGQSIFGTGDIPIPVDDSFSDTSKNPVENRLVFSALKNKADAVSIEALNSEIHNKADRAELEHKQNILKPGANITINEEGIISAEIGITFIKLDPGQSLPSVGLSNAIYLLPKDGQYQELIWINGKWEDLGFIDVNLENYFTKLEIQTLLDTKVENSRFIELSNKVTQNEIDIAKKVNQTSFDTSVELINSSIKEISNTIKNKADKSELTEFAKTEDIPDVSKLQPRLENTKNIKSINGENLLGSGNIILTNTEIADLGKYLEIEAYDADIKQKLSFKLDKSEAFSGSYNDLVDKPILDNMVTNNTLEFAVSQLEKAIDKKQNTLANENFAKINGETVFQDKDFEVLVAEDLNGYATEQWVEDKNYLTEHQDISHLALKTEIPSLKGYAKLEDIPKPKINISEFFNDSGYAVATDVANTYETKEDALDKHETATKYTDTEISKVRIDFASKDAETLTSAKNFATLEANRVEALIGANDTALVKQATDYTDAAITNLINGADEAYNTFKEIADYISSDKSGAATMASDINTNKESIKTINATLLNKADKSEVATVNANIEGYKITNNAALEAANTLASTANTTATTANNTANANATAIAAHATEFTNYKTTVSGEISRVEGLTKTNKANLEAHTEEFDTYKTNNNNEVKALKDDRDAHKLRLDAHDEEITTVKAYKTSIDKNTEDIATNAADIKTNADDILAINEEIESINETFDNYYTAEQSDAKYITSTGTVAKSQGIIDYQNTNKQIRFTTEDDITDFEISTVDANSVLTLLSVMVPNEY